MRSNSPRPVQGDVVRARLDALVAELGSPAEAAPASAADHAGADHTPPEALPDGPRRTAPPAVRHPVVRRVWEFGRAQAAVIGVIGLVGLLGAVWAISQARTVPVAVAAPTPVAPTVAAVPSATPTPTPELLRVHVLGAVVDPGVVRLPAGSRVEDAIAAAGGLAEGARPGELNLAAPVVDGAQVVMGDSRNPGGELRGAEGAGPGATGAGTSSAGARVDLNTATQEQFEALPGVGPVTAQAILAWRQQHKRFSRVDELLEIDGIGPKTFQQLEPHVTV